MELLNFYTDGPKSRDGVWIDCDDGGRVKIARMDNPNYKAFVQRQKAERGRRTLTDEETKQLLAQGVAETVLVDWEGVTINGQEVPYSIETALVVFEALPQFLEWVVAQAYESANFREDEIDDVMAKLGPMLAGV